jgi:hypothetical protein
MGTTGECKMTVWVSSNIKLLWLCKLRGVAISRAYAKRDSGLRWQDDITQLNLFGSNTIT